MKLLAICVILGLVAARCALAAGVAVGLYAPDRYDGIPEMCLMPMDFGHCRAKVKRYYFDMRRMKCTMFYWGGCAGNINNFKSMDECNKVCLDAFEAERDEAPAPVRERPTNYNGRSSSNNSNNNSNISSNTGTGTGSSASFKPYKTPGKDNANHFQSGYESDN